ncbi:MAG: hypothetical protein ACC742_14560 [Thermoanaerobaculales bacterium]
MTLNDITKSAATTARRALGRRTRHALTAIAVLLAAAIPALAQSPVPAASQKNLSATMNVYVFPTVGQDAAQQSNDEAECYEWAAKNTGVDPFDLAKKAFAVCLEAKKYMVKF